MARKDMLGKLGMPKKPMADMEAEQDLMLEEDMGMGEEGDELLEGEPLDEELPEELSPLDDLADDDLIAEMKKRGLSLEDEGSEDDMAEDDLELEGEEEDMGMLEE